MSVTTAESPGRVDGTLTETPNLVNVSGSLTAATPAGDVVVFMNGAMSVSARAAQTFRFAVPLDRAPGSVRLRVFHINRDSDQARELAYPPPCSAAWPFAPPASWEGTDCNVRVRSPLRIEDGRLRAELRFSDASIRDFQGPGWSYESGSVGWATGFQSVLQIPLPERVVNLRFTARIKPFLASARLDRQQVFVVANGQPLADWVLDEDQMRDMVVEIPDAILKISPESLELRFLTPDSASPRSLDAGADLRKLGIALASISFEGDLPP